MPIIKLMSSDGDIFDKDLEGVLKRSMTLKTFVEDLQLEEDEEQVLPLYYVSTPVLEKVIDWAKYHKDDPLLEEDDENREKRTNDVGSWDKEFMKEIDQGTLWDLFMAANALDMKGLLDVACKTVTNLVKGKTPEEIRQSFGIKNDFPSEEEEATKKENEWCEEK